MRYYIGEQEIRLVVGSIFSETQDETCDTFRCELAMNDEKNPYAPLQKFKVVWDDGKVSLFVIVNDTVSIVSQNPLKYKHTLTLIQNIHELSKHIARNSIFTQPSNVVRKGNYSATYNYNPSTNVYESYLAKITSSLSINNHWNTSISLTNKERAKRFKYKINLYTVKNSSGNNSYLTKCDDLSLLENVSFTFTIRRNNTIVKARTITEIGKADTFYYIDDFIEGDKNFELSATINYRSIKTQGAGTGIDEISNVVVNIDYEIEVYHFDCYDILESIANQYKKERAGYEGITPLYSLPSRDSELGILLTQTIPPNMFFKQTSIYEIVYQVFSLFDAIFTLDENNVLGIEYFNDNNGKVIEGKFSKTTITYKEDNYNNKILNSYQNAVQKVKHPTSSYAKATSQSVGQPSQTDHIFATPEVIDWVDTFKILYSGVIRLNGITSRGRLTYDINVVDMELDISYFVRESKLWGLLDLSISYPQDTVLTIEGVDYSLKTYSRLLQNCTLQYTKGASYIPLRQTVNPDGVNERHVLYYAIEGALRQMFGFNYDSYANFAVPSKPDVNAASLNYHTFFGRLEYVSNTSGTFAIETNKNKYDGEFYTNQQATNVDLDKLGGNIVGLSYRTGNELLVLEHEIVSYDDTIKKGDILLKDGVEWVATVCTYTFFNDVVKGNIEFTKNYNALNVSTRIDNEIRMTNIDNAFEDKCVEWINEYVYVSLTSLDIADKTCAIRDSEIYNLIAKTFGYDYSKNIDYVAYKVGYYLNPIYYPLRKYSAGFNVCLEMAFNSSISAGNRDINTSGEYNIKPVLYTDENGWVDECDILFLKDNKTTYFNSLFPALEREKVYSEDDLIGSILNWKCYKRPNEILSLNYQLVFLGNDKLFIGKEFIKNNGIIKDQDNEIYFYASYNMKEKYSILDTKVIDGSIKLNITDVSVNQLEGSITLVVDYGLRPLLTHRWAIGDKYGNIYIACNDVKLANTPLKLYFTTTKKRI